MLRLILPLLLIQILLPVRLVVAEKVSAEAARATDKRLRESIEFLASDKLEGRGVGTQGLDAAADYLAKQFASLGLATEIYDGQPFQKFTVDAATSLGKAEDNYLTLSPTGSSEDTAPIKLKLGEDFNPLAAGGSGKVQGDLVFVGYGITAKNYGYDDYAEVDVKGKVVLMLRKEPQQANPDSKFDGTRPSQHATFKRKISNARDHGAVAVIIVNNAHDGNTKRVAEEKRWRDTIGELAKLNQWLLDRSPPSSDDVRKQLDEGERLSKQLQESTARLQGDFDEIINFQSAGYRQGRTMPVFFASRASVKPIVQAVLGKSLAAIETEIDQTFQPQSAALEGWQASGETSIITNKAEVKNVIAVLPGEGPLSSEYVVIGAHYDHLGMGGRGTLAPWTVAVHNGADDNASGTAVLIEIARQLTARQDKPRRSVVFIAFTGEERGLLGSDHYVKNPRFPLDKTVAMLNLDMVGRLKDNKLIIQGLDTATEFHPMIDRLNETYEFDLNRKKGGSGPSDHASFYPKNIPVMHFFTGLHSDYHRPSDDADKVNITGMRRIAGLVTDVALEIAHADKRPEYVKTKPSRLFGRAGARPYLGIVPDLTSEVDGAAVTDVAEGGPAAAGRLQAGDVITKLGQHKITSFDDLIAALGKLKAGKKVPVIVNRDGTAVTLEVTLGEPR